MKKKVPWRGRWVELGLCLLPAASCLVGMRQNEITVRSWPEEQRNYF